jgi:myo-inositol-1(or 4)-monophosphatase
MSESSSTLQLDRYLQVASRACDGARSILNSHFGNLRKVDEKFQAGLVSEADRASEKYINELIRSQYPDHRILGEEFGLSGTANDASNEDVLWLIDPLDGTTNYVHQFPFFCISVGLEVNGELVLGVVDAPKLDLRFHAVKGGGAFLNGEAISVSRRTEFREGLFATGFSSHDDRLNEQLDLVAQVTRDARGIRRAGAAALDLCFVAQGVFDVFWEKNLAPWDTAAGVVIVREAGGVATDMDGKPFDVRGPSVLAGSPALHAEIKRRYKDVKKL